MTCGFRTVAIHWPHDLPWLRLARRVSLTRHENSDAASAGQSARCFRRVLVVDGLNVLFLAASAARGTSKDRDASAPETPYPLGVASVGIIAWLCALAAGALVSASGPDTAQARRSAGHARLLIWLGFVVNTLGSSVIALMTARKKAGRKVGFARAVYLLVGGAAVSFAYLRDLEER